MSRRIVVLLTLFLCVKANAQPKTYTLEQCIEQALQQNLQISQAGYESDRAGVRKAQAKLNMLPNLNASASHSWNMGRGIDNTTNTFVDNNFYSGNYNVGGDVTLFQGFGLRHAVKQSTFAHEASKMNWQQQKDNITLNIILAYLQLMNAQDLLTQAKDQAALSEKQVQRLKDMDEKGAVAPSELFDMEGQYASDQALIINATRDVETAKIAICNWMNIPFSKEMTFERIAVQSLVEKEETNPAEAYTTALERFAQVKAADFRLKSAALGVKAARAALFPTLKFGYGMGSSYAQFNGSISSQLSNNTNKNLGFTLSIPIFNSLQARNDLKMAKIDLKDETALNKTVKTELQQNVETAHVNMTAAFDRYKKLLEQVAAFQKSFTAAEARFNVGQGNSIDYLTVKNNLDRANVNLIAGKYEYLLRVKIYNYYQGITNAGQ